MVLDADVTGGLLEISQMFIPLVKLRNCILSESSCLAKYMHLG